MFAIVAALIASVAGQTAPPPPPPARACTVPPGWDAVARVRPRYVVFGEMHGTREMPAFVGDVACALAAKGRRVLVAIEHPSRFDPMIQAAWRLPPERFGEALRSAGWAGRNDGTASEAMVDVIVRLHALKTAGQPIDIVAFNGVRDEGQRARLAPLTDAALHEAAQADNIRAAAEPGRYNDVLVLVGNVHARREPVVMGEISYEPMAMRLARFGRVVTLNAKTAGGQHWACMMRPGFAYVPGMPMPKDAIACGAHPLRADRLSGVAGSISLNPATKEAGDSAYDGVFHVGTVTASSPAVPVAPAR